jgi:hypothetical protein
MRTQPVARRVYSRGCMRAIQDPTLNSRQPIWMESGEETEVEARAEQAKLVHKAPPPGLCGLRPNQHRFLFPSPAGETIRWHDHPDAATAIGSL